MRVSPALAWAAAAALAGCGEAPNTCQIARATDLPLALEDGLLITDVAVNGSPLRLIVDTGSFATMLTQETVVRLDLPTPVWTGERATGYGGSRAISLSHSAKFKLGTLEGKDVPFAVAIGDKVLGDTRADGLLGMDILSHFDLDFDLPDHKLILYQALEGCTHPSAVLDGALYDLPMVTRIDTHDVMVAANIAGQRLTALLDSGSAENVVPRPTAHHLGLDAAALAGDETGTLNGMGRRAIHARRHVMEQITVGDLAISNMPVAIIDERGQGSWDLALGTDLFTRVHVWLSFSSNTVILQYPPRASPAAIQ